MSACDDKKGEMSFSLQSLSRLPVMCITFWFNMNKIARVFSFSITFVERISRLEEDFVFNCISQQHLGEDVRKQNVCWLARYCKERISGKT